MMMGLILLGLGIVGIGVIFYYEVYLFGKRQKEIEELRQRILLEKVRYEKQDILKNIGVSYFVK